jgi:hypothetical protein
MAKSQILVSHTLTLCDCFSHSTLSILRIYSYYVPVPRRGQGHLRALVPLLIIIISLYLEEVKAI